LHEQEAKKNFETQHPIKNRRLYLRVEPIHNTLKSLVKFINFLLWSGMVIDFCPLILSSAATP